MQAKPEKFGIKFLARRDGRTLYMTMYQLFTGKRDRTPIQLQYGLGYRDVHDLTLKLVGLSRHVYHYRFLTGVASPGRYLHLWYTKSKPKEDPLLTMTKEIRHETTDSHVWRFSSVKEGQFISNSLELKLLQCCTCPTHRQL